MSIITWIIVGLIAGALAKWLMPGNDGGGWLATCGLGIAGSFAGGFLGSLLGIGASGFVGTIVVATVGALVLLFIYNRFIR
ncbi:MULTISPECIES: GlsB/YeaQ/YmgE family stress response membrane protein [Photobacterium]|uniref:Transglycosylase associated family protein n=3 Tax=Photobacterium leiognathi TaxID=553611 RepID=X0NLQ9_PHOLE|nr:MULTISPECIES: GlsB/YeaQ/YmgE family stress response membrane protein [Photobacterium]MBP2699659.1 GlsB/YeaQ/YmgE family stress response membrane protein [Vibrio parahaemolyticus]KJF90552.1 hypothetical protein UB42_07370 [Photobacterium leiognathi]KJF99937.1 hypothetical protein UB34_00520 [Photobacterium leiognathi]KPA54282.1 hypothetical protein VT25_04425 [Photobacterium leiognathi subsp. mandapamensis]MCG3884253.1 GlsB/YeaQ/YmgE family stress response membrane protein [Photobacterium le